MAYIIEVPNVYEPLTDVRKHMHPGGISIRRWLTETKPGFVEFEVPTICLLNGEPMKREQWDRVIQKDDIVNFIAIPGATVVLIITLIIAIASIVISLVIGPPKTPGETPTSNPVFSTKGQSNSIRLGEPIECPYGRNRIWPSYASRPYFQYIDNDQFQYSLFCIGQGLYDIEEIKIGDTDITSFEEVEYQVIEPEGSVALFPTSVYTAPEVGGQTLFATSDDEYTGEGWVGPFITNPSNTEANAIQFDVVMPKGLYAVDDDGDVNILVITIQFQAREIDDSGVAIGGWFALTSPSVITYSARDTTPIRKTVSQSVSLGRYEVRGRRTNSRIDSYKVGHEIVWEGLRSYIQNEQDFGDVTLLAVKIRATSNLNEQTQQQFNVIATRKLPIYEAGQFSEPQATRSIIWAFVDVFRSLYGGRVVDSAFFDWDALWELDTLYESRGEYFDWVFRDPITVWEAAQAIARAGRAVPLIVGSLISIKRDGIQSIPVTMFTPDNIVEGTFQWQVKLWDIDEHDSVRVEYTEPATGYKQETVLCILPGGSSNYPRDVRLPGVQDRNHAYHEGMYMLASEQHLRENITLETGLEGYLPTFGDLVAVSHDVPRWAQSGYIVHAEAGEGDAYQLWVSEPLIFEDDAAHQIMLRGSKAEVIGPLNVYKTTDSKQITVIIPGTIDFLLGGETEPMLFLFGTSSFLTKYCRIVRIEPQGQERIRISAVNDESIIHSFDSLTAPALNTLSTPPVTPDLPEIPALYITQIAGTLQIVQVSWLAAFGAQYYVVQTSRDGDNWQNRAETTRTSVQFQAPVGSLYVRVAGVNIGQGPWIQDQITVGFLQGLDLLTPWDVLEWEIAWFDVLNNLGYVVNVYDIMTSSAPVLKRTLTLAPGDLRTFQYDYEDALADGNLVREMLVEVDVLFQAGASGNPTSLPLSNAVPAAPTALQSLLLGPGSDEGNIPYLLYWTVPEEEDLIRVKVWVSETEGFDPEAVSPLIDEEVSEPGYLNIPSEVVVEITNDGGHPTLYWRVAVFDVWGNEISTNVSVEAVIDSYVILINYAHDDFEDYTIGDFVTSGNGTGFGGYWSIIHDRLTYNYDGVLDYDVSTSLAPIAGNNGGHGWVGAWATAI